MQRIVPTSILCITGDDNTNAGKLWAQRNGRNTEYSDFGEAAKNADAVLLLHDGASEKCNDIKEKMKLGEKEVYEMVMTTHTIDRRLMKPKKLSVRNSFICYLADFKARLNS